MTITEAHTVSLIKHIALGSNFAVFLVTGMFYLLSMPADAQPRVGLRAGVNITSFSISEDDYFWKQSNVSSYLGPVFGGIFQFDLSDAFFLRAEPLYIQKGTNYTVYESTFTGMSFGHQYPLKLEFLEFPVSIGLQVGKGPLRLYTFAGPDFGYMLTRGYSRTDLALDAGVGISYAPTENVSILLDGRYSAGLNNLNTQDPYAPTFRSRGVQPMVGILLRP